MHQAHRIASGADREQQARNRPRRRSMEELLARHRKERKDLTNRITSLKKQASKKTRKQVNATCVELEQELSQRHSAEVAELNGEPVPSAAQSEVSPEQLLAQLELSQEDGQGGESAVSHEGPAAGKKRRNRQRERLDKREAELARLKAEALKEAAEQPNLKEIEQASLDKVCELAKLKQVDIQPDGHCLFNSVLDQLRARHSGSPDRDRAVRYAFPQGYEGPVSVADMDAYALRTLACQYMRQNKDDFLPYLFDENTMSMRDLDEYTRSMESSALWGGELELLALSKVFNCPISVLMSGRSTYRINDGSENPELKLVYYKHTYTLGEHYNSLHDL